MVSIEVFSCCYDLKCLGAGEGRHEKIEVSEPLLASKPSLWTKIIEGKESLKHIFNSCVDLQLQQLENQSCLFMSAGDVLVRGGHGG